MPISDGQKQIKGLNFSDILEMPVFEVFPPNCRKYYITCYFFHKSHPSTFNFKLRSRVTIASTNLKTASVYHWHWSFWGGAHWLCFYNISGARNIAKVLIQSSKNLKISLQMSWRIFNLFWISIQMIAEILIWSLAEWYCLKLKIVQSLS